MFNECTYSFDSLPGLYAAHSTFVNPGFHSSPSVAQNSASVSPGGRRRIISLSRGALALSNCLPGTSAFAPFLVAAAGIDRMPFRPLADVDML